MRRILWVLLILTVLLALVSCTISYSPEHVEKTLSSCAGFGGTDRIEAEPNYLRAFCKNGSEVRVYRER